MTFTHTLALSTTTCHSSDAICISMLPCGKHRKTSAPAENADHFADAKDEDALYEWASTTLAGDFKEVEDLVDTITTVCERLPNHLRNNDELPSNYGYLLSSPIDRTWRCSKLLIF